MNIFRILNASFCLGILFFCFLAFGGNPAAGASSGSFVNIVNPIRGEEFWDLKDQSVIDAVAGQSEILRANNLKATWLIRFDALSDEKITALLKSLPNDEKGVFIEITPSLTQVAGVPYHQSKTWHSAGSIFLTGYSNADRRKIIDALFEAFRFKYGSYPKSVGAWWIDADSLSYMSSKYQIESGLIVADQFSTDNYQIWGQYWSAPYYPYKKNALFPAQSNKEKIPVVLMQWASRDPFNGYGKAVEESTFSVQANDYIDYHKLGIDYFDKLVDIYTKQDNPVNELVIGLENSYPWPRYRDEFASQVKLIKDKVQTGQLNVLTMSEFGRWYKKTFPEISPTISIHAKDPLGSGSEVFWFMNPFYRAGVFFDKAGVQFRDLRQYVEGTNEECLEKVCNEINFAPTFLTSIDQVSFGRGWLLDEGRVSNLRLIREEDKILIQYANEAHKEREIGFLPRDIAIGKENMSIGGAILKATMSTASKKNLGQDIDTKSFLTVSQLMKILGGLVVFSIFFLIFVMIPGSVLVRDRLQVDLMEYIFSRAVCGIVLLTLAYYCFSLGHVRWLIFVYPCVFLFIFLKTRQFKNIFRLHRGDIFKWVLIIAGSSFQWIATIRSGLRFDFGVGFWGPNSHDGIWHISLVNEIIKNMPPQNPVFSGESLKNYHYFYDTLVALTSSVTRIDPADLIFRIYPFVFSLLLGMGAVAIIRLLNHQTESRTVFWVSLFLVYFSGSFGWIVEYIKNKTLGGESDFWVNQSVSYNLNPPFFVSLLVVVLIVLLISTLKLRGSGGWVSVFLIAVSSASLIEFKAYGAVLVFLSLGLLAIKNLKVEKKFLIAFVLGVVLSLAIYLPNKSSDSVFTWKPFWFIHSMIDSPDRVGWLKLSAAREAYFSKGLWLKFILVEAVALVLFLVGNLGVRIIGLVGILKTKSRENDVLVFIASLVLSSISIPVFLIQKGNPWNAIQFFYYSLFFMAIFTGLGLSSLKGKMPTLIYIFILLVICAVAPINSFSSARGYFHNNPHAYVSSAELEATDFLKLQPDGVVLTYPFDKALRSQVLEPFPLFVYETTGYVGALANKQAYLSDEIQNEILQTDYIKRRLISKDFFEHSTPGQKVFLKETNIKYIYLLKFLNLSIDEPSAGVEKIFENSEVVIFRKL